VIFKYTTFLWFFKKKCKNFVLLLRVLTGRAKFIKNKQSERALIYKGVGLAFLIHGLLNFSLFINTLFGVVFALLLFLACAFFTAKAMRLHLKSSPFKK
jgi:hypothetical protein